MSSSSNRVSKIRQILSENNIVLFYNKCYNEKRSYGQRLKFFTEDTKSIDFSKLNLQLYEVLGDQVIGAVPHKAYCWSRRDYQITLVIKLYNLD